MVLMNRNFFYVAFGTLIVEISSPAIDARVAAQIPELAAAYSRG